MERKTFLSPIQIYRFPKDTVEVTYKTPPCSVLVEYDANKWAALINPIIEKHRQRFMDRLEKVRPDDEKYEHLHERLKAEEIGIVQEEGELRFAVTYSISDGTPLDQRLLSDYVAVQLMAFSYVSMEETVGRFADRFFAFDLDPADDEDEETNEYQGSSIFGGLIITKNRLTIKDDTMTQAQTGPGIV